jgi:hypothetical protein
MAVSPGDDGVVVHGGSDGRVVVRRASAPEKELSSHELSASEIVFVALSGSDSRILMGDTKGKVQLWDWNADKVIFECELGAPARQGALSPHLERALVTDNTGVVHLLDTGKGDELDRIDLKACGEVTSGQTSLPVSFLEDGRSFVVGLSRGPILRYDPK